MKKVLFVGKLCQLNSVLMTQILETLKQKGYASEHSEIEYQTMGNQMHFPRLVHKMKNPTVLLVGLKAETINMTIGHIDRNTKNNPKFLIVAWEGEKPSVCPTVEQHVSFYTREEFGIRA